MKNWYINRKLVSIIISDRICPVRWGQTSSILLRHLPLRKQGLDWALVSGLLYLVMGGSCRGGQKSPQWQGLGDWRFAQSCFRVWMWKGCCGWHDNAISFLSWPWNCGPALHPQQGPSGCMGVCPTNPHVFCWLGEGRVLQEYRCQYRPSAPVWPVPELDPHCWQ